MSVLIDAIVTWSYIFEANDVALLVLEFIIDLQRACIFGTCGFKSASFLERVIWVDRLQTSLRAHFKVMWTLTNPNSQLNL